MQFLARIKRIFTIFAAYFGAVLHILKTRDELVLFLKEQRARCRSVGLVPTMGALHEGHLSLIARSTEENELTVCSIFVNPTQFNDPADLERYPRPFESDLEKLRMTACQALFMPDVEEMYPPGSGEAPWRLDLGDLENILEGAFRPDHYQGVTQVVKKLFDLVEPQRAYFGQKDYQQFLVVSKMVRLLDLPVELVCCPTLREPDGLAMSSRNVHLSPGERKEASLLSKALFLIKAAAPFTSGAAGLPQGGADHGPGVEVTTVPGNVAAGSGLPLEEARREALELLAASPLIDVEYLEIADARSLQPVSRWDDAPEIVALAAIRIGQTRLIDNVLI